MTGRDFILEIGTEEIPARFRPGAIEQFKEQALELLKSNRLAFTEVQTFGTPRRLALFITNLAGLQEDREERTKGPSKDAAFDANGKPTRAALAFAEKQGLRLDQLKLERYGKKEYLVAVREIPGEKTPELLRETLPSLLKSVVFPKNMVWEQSKARFARPIRWILCLFGEELVNFSYAGLSSGRETRGHRFLNPGPFVISSPSHYFSCLKESGVILDHKQRELLIREKVEDAACLLNGIACLDGDLLQEVTFLVESPEAISCSYPQSYLDLPREVLVTTMQSHQRYFPVEDETGTIRPFFIAVSNNGAAPMENIRRGNEKVLKARLADARFFYDEDQKVSLEERVHDLKNILFQEELGSLYEKTERLQKLTGVFLEKSTELTDEERRASLRSAFLAKADLTTHMVGEFPELQGIMGREYALRSGETIETAVAIFEHYLPRFAGDVLPSTIGGAVVALADKADHLAGCFAVGIRPSGSQDPYALRRQALGILHILLYHRLPFSFKDLIRQALLLLKKKLSHLSEEEIAGLTEDIRRFAWQRLRYIFQEEGIDYDIIEAVLSTPQDNITSLAERVRFLQANRESEDLKNAASAYIRVANLARNASPGIIPLEDYLIEDGEKQLFAALVPAEKEIRLAIEKEDLAGALQSMSRFRGPVDSFFEEILVMAEEEKIRNNRLALLKNIRDLYLQMADFSKIVFSKE